MSYVKRKKNTSSHTTVSGSTVVWDLVKDLPVRVLFISARDPLIGHVEWDTNKTRLFVYAPAFLVLPSPVNVQFVPPAFVESYMTLSSHAVNGSTPVSDVLREGYRTYLEHFIKGDYKLKPIVIQAGVDAPDGIHSIPLVETAGA